MGVGYFYSGLSGDLKDFFASVPPILSAPDLRDLLGVELYYNAAITPWFHLTADLQFVRLLFQTTTLPSCWDCAARSTSRSRQDVARRCFLVRLGVATTVTVRMPFTPILEQRRVS